MSRLLLYLEQYIELVFSNPVIQ